MSWLWVIGLGIIGVGSRFAVDSWIAKWGFAFPVGTLLINVAGCLLAGFVLSLGGQRELAADPVRLGIIVGFCGGFTTFSGFGLQFLQLIDGGRFAAAFAYGVASPVLCILATACGFLLSKMVSV